MKGWVHLGRSAYVRAADVVCVFPGKPLTDDHQAVAAGTWRHDAQSTVLLRQGGVVAAFVWSRALLGLIAAAEAGDESASTEAPVEAR